jgi:hypothetical protein
MVKTAFWSSLLLVYLYDFNLNKKQGKILLSSFIFYPKTIPRLGAGSACTGLKAKLSLRKQGSSF